MLTSTYLPWRRLNTRFGLNPNEAQYDVTLTVWTGTIARDAIRVPHNVEVDDYAPGAGDSTLTSGAVYREPGEDPQRRAVDLLSRMTIEEKVGQLSSQMFIDPKKARRDPLVGHVRNPAHFAHRAAHISTPAECAELINADQKIAVEGSRLGVPVLEHEEGLHGALWGDATCFPQAMALAATWDAHLVERIGHAIGSECRAVGVRQVLSPVVNLATDSRWGRAQETYGEDPWLSARMGSAYVRGVQSEGVVATPKHFVANYADGGRDSNAVQLSERTLRELYLVPFEACVRAGAAAIMPAYNSVDGTPCTSNRWLLQDVLRREWGFRGIVVSDYDAVPGLEKAHHVFGSRSDAAVAALHAGLNVELPNSGPELLEAVRAGNVSLPVLDAAVSEVLTLKFELGLFEHPYADPAKADAIVRCAEHQALALEGARKSMTLLKNEQHVLPFSKDIKTLGVFGPTAGAQNLGDYSFPYGHHRAPKETPLQAFARLKPQVRLLAASKGEDARAVAQQCDALVMFTSIDEDEGRDRSALGLPGGTDGPRKYVQAAYQHGLIVDESTAPLSSSDQVGLIHQLAATGKPLVVVLINGSAVSMQDWEREVPGVLEAWYPGELGSQAIVETLFGDNNPAGRLPITFPKSVGQLPLVYNYKPSGRGLAYNDDAGKPLFPFGHGLSYTSFEYAGLKLDPPSIGPAPSSTVSCTIRNTGGRAGEEVVQLYLHDAVGSVARPVQELKGCARVRLDAGETTTVVMHLGAAELSAWNAQMQQAVEPGDFEIMLGASCADVRLRGTLHVN
jgi:beta-glucosidase